MKSSVPAFHVKRVLLTVQGNYFLANLSGSFEFRSSSISKKIFDFLKKIIFYIF